MESGYIGEWVFPQKEGRSLTDVSKFALTEWLMAALGTGGEVKERLDLIS